MEQPEEEECVVCGKMVVVDEDCDCCEDCGGSGVRVENDRSIPCPACVENGRVENK